MGCQAASQQLLLTKGKPKTAGWSWLCKAWLFYNHFLFFLIWKTGLSFPGGVSTLGQSQNCGQPWQWAPACEQGLCFAQCSVFSPVCSSISIFLMITLQTPTRNFSPVTVQQTFNFCSQIASQKLESTLKCVYPFAHMVFKFHTVSLKLLVLIRFKFQDFFSKFPWFLVLSSLFTNIFLRYLLLFHIFSMLSQN